MKDAGHFARQSTGLVRQIGAFDAFVYNQSFINAGLILLLALMFVPSVYPGASLVLAAVIAVVIAIPTSLTHGLLAAAFPRSGGDYVYNSRVLSPAWGFAANWNITIWLLFYTGFGCYAFPQFGLSPLLRFMGAAFGSQELQSASMWLTTRAGIFLAGTLILLIVVLCYMVSTRLIALLHRWYFILGVTSLLLLIGALFTCDTDTFVARLNSYCETSFGVSHATEYASAKAGELGFAPQSALSLTGTLVVLYYVANFFFWGNASTYLGGEIRRAHRSQILSMPSAVLVTGILIVLAFWAFNGCVGNQTLGAIGYLLLVVPEESVPVFYSEFGALAAGKAWLGVLILAGCTYWPAAFALAPLGPTTRNVLAWSFDRLFPERLSDVHPRMHTPIWAILACGLVVEIGLILFTFVPFFSAMVGIVGAFLTYLVTSVSAVVLPFRKRKEFESSPINWRCGRVPVLCVVGAASIVGIVLCDISVLSDPFSGISLSPEVDAGAGKGLPFTMLLINLGIFCSGFVVYGIANVVQRARGLDIRLAFKEIPPE